MLEKQLQDNYGHLAESRDTFRKARKAVLAESSAAGNIGHFASTTEDSGASLCSMNFQYPNFASGGVQRPVAFWRRPVRIRPVFPL